MNKPLPQLGSDNINVVISSETEFYAVFDGVELVQASSLHKFYYGYKNLTKYKQVDLGQWEGATSLAKLLSNGLGKNINKINVTHEELLSMIGR